MNRRDWLPFREPREGEHCADCWGVLVAAVDDRITHCQYCDRLFCCVLCAVRFHLNAPGEPCRNGRVEVFR